MENQEPRKEPRPKEPELPSVEFAEEEDLDLPPWLKTVEHEGDFLWYVKTRHDGVFVLKEVSNAKVKSAIKRGKPSDMSEEAIIAASLVEPKLGELNISKMSGGDVVRLKFATAKMYNMEYFLSLA